MCDHVWSPWRARLVDSFLPSGPAGRVLRRHCVSCGARHVLGRPWVVLRAAHFPAPSVDTRFCPR